MSNSDNSNQQSRQRLYQERIRDKSRFPGLRSKTESRESYRLDAIREYGRLKVNGTKPNHIVQLNYLTELSVEEIQALWRKHRRRLHAKGIIARVTIEITKDEWRQRPVNRIHYHFVVKDHSRTRDELTELIETVCQCEMALDDFKVNVFQFDEKKGGWKGYIAYFVKLRDPENENILFEKGLGLRKYYTIGQWWTDKDGITPLTLSDINKKMRRYAIARSRLKKSEKFIPVRYQAGEWELPTDYGKLQSELDKRTDEMLYDWFAILQGKPIVFHTKPPKWLLDDIQSQPLKRNDLLDAIFERIQYSKNSDIVFALEIYHGYECSIPESKDNKMESENISPYPNELIGQVDFMIDVLDSIGEEFSKSEYRHYIIDKVSAWASNRKADLSPP